MSDWTQGGTLARCTKCAAVQVKLFKNDVCRRLDVTVITTIRSSAHGGASDGTSRQPAVQRYRWFVIFACLLSLPGCSGCQKTTPESPTKAQEAVAPPVDPTPEQESAAEAPEEQTESKFENETVPTAKSNESTDDKTGGSPVSQPGTPSADSKSATSGSGSPKVGASPRPKGGSKTGAPADQASSPKTGRSPPTAAEALESARGLHEKSIAAAERGNYGKAFDLSSQAWEMVHAFSKDSECQALSNKLEAELELLAERANALIAPGDANTKRLVDQ